MTLNSTAVRAAPEKPTVQWERTYGGSDNDDTFSVVQTSDGDGFDSRDKFVVSMKENRNLERKKEELERKVVYLQSKSGGLASGIAKRNDLIGQKESEIDDLNKEIDKLEPIEKELRESVDNNASQIKLACLVFAMADRKIGERIKYGSQTPWGFRQMAFEKLKKEYGVDPYDWKELQKEINQTAGLIVSNPSLRSVLLEAMTEELVREGMPPPKPHEDPAEYVGRFSKEELRKVWIKEN